MQRNNISSGKRNKRKTLENKTVEITNNMLKLPGNYVLLAYMIILPVLLGVITYNINLNLQTVNLRINDMISTILKFETTLFASSTIIIITSKIVRKSARYKYLIGMATVSETIYGVAYTISQIIPNVGDIALYVASGIATILWYFGARIIFSVKWRAIVHATMQLFIFLAFLSISNMAFSSSNYSLTDITKYTATNIKEQIKIYAVVGILALIIGYVLITIGEAPIKRTFGFGIIDVANVFVEQWLYGGKELEGILDEIGERCNTVATVLKTSISMDKDSEEYPKHVAIVSPGIHYGPFGNIGSSDFPGEMARVSSKGYEYVAVHSTATHDLNLTSTVEKHRVAESIVNISNKIKPKERHMIFNEAHWNNATCHGFIFGKAAILMLTRHPHTTEDLSFGCGLVLKNLGRSYGYECMLVDEHNAETGEVKRYYPETKEFYDYYMATKRFFETINHKNKEKISIGFKRIHVNNKSVGGGGISVFSICKKYIIVVIDSNGITPMAKDVLEKEIINEIMKKTGKRVKVIIATTDTHEKNGIRGVINPIDIDKGLFSIISSISVECIKKEYPASVGIQSEWIGVKALGPDRATSIISTINSSFAVIRVFMITTILAAICGVVYYIISGG